MRKRVRKLAHRAHTRKVRQVVVLTRCLQLGQLPLSNVNNRSQHERPVGCVDGTKPDFDRYLASVIAPPKEFPPLCAHRASLGMAKVTLPKVSVARPEPLGNKHLNRTAKEFLARVAECFLGL